MAGSANTKQSVIYSTDGKNWTESNITGIFGSAYYANGIFVICSLSDYMVWGIYYSTDGMTWTQSNITVGKFKNTHSIHNDNGIWVAASIDDGIYYSIDGKTWTQSNIETGQFNNVYNANGIWVATSNNGLYYSVTWEVS